MGDNLHLMESFLKINGITHNKITPTWSQANEQVEWLNRIIKKAIQSAVNKGCNGKHELNKFLLGYRKTPQHTIGKAPSFLLFSRVDRDKLPTVPSAADDSRHGDTVKRKPALKEKNENLSQCETRSKTNWVKGRGRYFNQTYRYERQIYKLLGKWVVCCSQGKQAWNYC